MAWGGGSLRHRQAAPSAPLGDGDEAQRYRALERAWQDGVGYALLDTPYEAPGSRALFFKQWDRLIARIDRAGKGVLLEVGCGKGHFLRQLRAVAREPRPLVGVDISRAVFSLPPQGLAGVRADGECLPFRDCCVRCVIYDGSLHHMIDYRAALREAIRVLAPGGTLIIFEPMTSWFNQLAHRLLDPLVFRKVVYESPIDIRYKKAFRLDKIIEVLRSCDMAFEVSRSDFLAYAFTGCYAGSVFARSERFMRFLMAVEDWVAAMPLLHGLAQTFAWRFTVVATKDGRACTAAQA